MYNKNLLMILTFCLVSSTSFAMKENDDDKPSLPRNEIKVEEPANRKRPLDPNSMEDAGQERNLIPNANSMKEEPTEPTHFDKEVQKIYAEVIEKLTQIKIKEIDEKELMTQQTGSFIFEVVCCPSCSMSSAQDEPAFSGVIDVENQKYDLPYHMTAHEVCQNPKQKIDFHNLKILRIVDEKVDGSRSFWLNPRNAKWISKVELPSLKTLGISLGQFSKIDHVVDPETARHFSKLYLPDIVRVTLIGCGPEILFAGKCMYLNGIFSPLEQYGRSKHDSSPSIFELASWVMQKSATFVLY